MLDIFTYLYIFPLSVNEKGWDKGRKCEKWKVGERGGNGLLQSEFLFISNFMEVKCSFSFEYEGSVMWGTLLSDDND